MCSCVSMYMSLTTMSHAPQTDLSTRLRAAEAASSELESALTSKLHDMRLHMQQALASKEDECAVMKRALQQADVDLQQLHQVQQHESERVEEMMHEREERQAQVAEMTREMSVIQRSLHEMKGDRDAWQQEREAMHETERRRMRQVEQLSENEEQMKERIAEVRRGAACNARPQRSMFMSLHALLLITCIYVRSSPSSAHASTP